ncbi:hypothetical protein CERSUDRAFT_113803 [Gelatoporia subvermispora B]|uniref:Uncharacterized protein n=1 Tax=Ceriporiopsis subvermispora (strain B) TaxID=914234 RepID=M2R271_CERS8|nr:hypothetical protein CERSUDRAFT_113803 [Gelatoporia subvermispora B]
MTWVLGWPLEIDWAVKYAKKRNLCKEGTEDIEQLYHAAGFDITRRLGVPPEDVPVLACWDNYDLKAVYALYVDKKARSADKARMRLSKMPPKRVAFKLGCMLGVDEAPKWYEYDGGRPYGSDYSDSDSSEDEDSTSTESEPDSPTSDHHDQMADSVAERAHDADATPRTSKLEIPELVDKAVQTE